MSKIKFGKEIAFHKYLRPLRLLEVTDPDVSNVVVLANARPHLELYEWWVLPPFSLFWEDKSLELALLNSTNELVEMCLGLSDAQLSLGPAIKDRICSELLRKRPRENFTWCFESTQIPGHGPVVRVTFGLPPAMAEARRRKVVPQQIAWT